MKNLLTKSSMILIISLFMIHFHQTLATNMELYNLMRNCFNVHLICLNVINYDIHVVVNMFNLNVSNLLRGCAYWLLIIHNTWLCSVSYVVRSSVD